MKTTKITGTSFREIYAPNEYKFSEEQKEAKTRIIAGLINDSKIDRKGRNQYFKLKEKGYDILIEPGNRKDLVKVIAAKLIVTQGGIEDNNDAFVIGSFSKENASNVSQKIRDRKLKRRLTTIPFFAFLAGILSLAGVAKYNSCTRQEAQKIQNVVSDTIKQDSVKTTVKTLNLSKFLH